MRHDASPESLQRRVFTLSEAHELTPEGTNAPKRKPGRPRNVNPEIESLKMQLTLLLRQNEMLQETVIAERTNKQLPTLATVPEATEALRPGTYVQVGIDASGTPIMGKVRWTREWITKTYPQVTFTPTRSMRVAPHGIAYDLAAEYEITVPQIVKDLYDDVRRQEADHNYRYRPLAAAEDADLAVKANELPGTKQWSRLYRAGYGLQVRMPEPEQPPSQ